MCDELTDLRNRTELSVCVQYIADAGTTTESFVEIVLICDAKAETITNKIVHFRISPCRLLQNQIDSI